MQTHEGPSTAERKARYAILLRWWNGGALAMLVVLAFALFGLISGQGLGALKPIYCGFLAAMMALGGMVLALWRGFIESNQQVLDDQIGSRS
ncbi:hypothetical protein [Micropruina sp.]|jgi:hypothetical protein|uniref:hypothetical protein n=1 Tax=Micropruina sp. TaxID=2737536 RepID=UPI002611CFEC|nr:hypothetical protein [Micropruina sp.]